MKKIKTYAVGKKSYKRKWTDEDRILDTERRFYMHLAKLPESECDRILAQLEELDKQILALENAEYDPSSRLSDEIKQLLSLEYTGWFYPDDDESAPFMNI